MSSFKRLFVRPKPELSSLVQSLIELMESDKKCQKVEVHNGKEIYVCTTVYLSNSKYLIIDFNTGGLSYHSVLSDKHYGMTNHECNILFQVYKKYAQRKKAIGSETEEIQDAIDCAVQKLKEEEE